LYSFWVFLRIIGDDNRCVIARERLDHRERELFDFLN
jgi:hypothetical protein